MITEEIVATIWRMYPGKTAAEVAAKPPFPGVCTIFYMTPELIYVKGLRADMDRVMQREFLDFCIARGIERIRAEREPGRTLPLARRLGEDDMTETRVSELVKRVRQSAKPSHSGRHRRAGEADWQPTQPGEGA